MKSRPVAFVIAAGFIFAGLSAMATTPPESTPANSAASTASAAAPLMASASSSARAPRPAPRQPLESQSIPKEPSERPTLDEWKSAIPIAVTRHSYEASACQAFRVREWLKVKCDMVVGAIKQQGGSPEHVFFWMGPHDGLSWDKVNGGEVMFPMRTGDQRVIEFFSMVPEQCFGRQVSPWFIVDEMWVEGETSPTVVIR